METKKKDEPIYRVQALERALDILDCFSFQKREQGLSEISEETGLNMTTAKRLIANLTSRGYLSRIPDSKRYQLGMRLFELGGIVFSSFSLRKVAAHHITHLQTETGFTVLLGALMDDQLVYVDKREGNAMIRIASDIGWRRPPHYGMLGMVLMAFLDSGRVKEILKKAPLEKHTDCSITDEDAFSIRLEQIRKKGFVLEREEAVEGVIGIAAPVRDYTRQVIGSLGVAIPLTKSNSKKDLEKTIELVEATCDAISSDLGYLKI
ncbi:MAG: IclR family transcriptional regulator [Deltaproteobacteria bacterium]|nr:IclR family transcriptional regulator [Deltaproteobacteria bacterium]